MIRNVCDFKDIRKLEMSDLSKELKKGTIITATSELADSLSDYYPQYSIIDIHKFIYSIIPEWEDEVKDIKNYVMLRNVIEEYISDNEVNETVATYLRRNSTDMWNSIKLLIEADVYPHNIPDSVSDPIDRFKGIWKKLEIQNDKIVSFRSVFNYDLQQRDKLIDKIRRGVGDICEDLFLIGFYFITPLQDRIFDLLSNGGYKLTFLNCHDNNYAYATEIWEHTFREEYESKSVRDIQADIKLENKFGEALLGNNNNQIEINQHYNDFQFAELIENAIKKGESVYSPNAKKSEKILREYLPDYYKEKHLLSYPVGQYIYYLHYMWDDRKNVIGLKFNYVFKCFATGWLTVDNLNAKDYLYKISMFKTYFKDCISVESWEKRLDELELAKKALNGFINRNHGTERWHRLLGDPFYNVGVYSVSENDINNIIKLIHKLIEDVKYLFSDGVRTDLYNHFQRITMIINDHMSEEETLQEELDIANTLINQLSDQDTKGLLCPMNGIRDAIILLIGGYNDEYESLDDETKDNKKIVLPLSMVEAEMLRNYGQKIHLVLADEMNLPGKPKVLPWPLTSDLLDSLNITNGNTIKYINDMRNVIENRPLSYRYLFYSYLGASNDNEAAISIEWICKNDKKSIDVSPYVRLIFDIKETQDEVDLEREENIIAGSNNSYLNNQLDVPDNNVPDEVRMDYLLCKQRYIYSYIVNYLPTYSSDFHYSFELSNLISAFCIISGINKSEVINNIKELFPFFRNIELRQSSDYAKSKGMPEPYEYEGVEYPSQRLLTHYLNEKLISECIRRDDNYLEEGIVEETIYSDGCVYCPYSGICMKRFENGVEAYEQEILG